MARLDEIAEGIVTVLMFSPTPEPLNLDLRGQNPQETTFLVRAIVDACERRGAPLSHVKVAPEAGYDLLKQYGSSRYQGVQISASSQLSGSLEFFRFPVEGLDS